MRGQLREEERNQLDRIRRGLGTADEMQAKFGDAEGVRAELKRIAGKKDEEAKAQARAKESSEKRADVIKQQAEESGLLQDPKMAKVVDKLVAALEAADAVDAAGNHVAAEAMRQQAYAAALEPIRSQAVGDVVAKELAKAHPDATIHREVRVMVDTGADNVEDAMRAMGRPYKAGDLAPGMRVRKVDGKDRYFMDVSDIDILVLEPGGAGGKLRIKLREELKSGANDSPSDAKGQLGTQSDLMQKDSDGSGRKIRLELTAGDKDITETIDLTAPGPGVARGVAEKAEAKRLPGQEHFDESIGVRSDELENRLKALLDAEIAKRAKPRG